MWHRAHPTSILESTPDWGSNDDDQTQETAQGLSAAAMLAQEQADDLDAILDDIETVLETNAEEYVSSFVQKGGE